MELCSEAGWAWPPWWPWPAAEASEPATPMPKAPWAAAAETPSDDICSAIDVPTTADEPADSASIISIVSRPPRCDIWPSHTPSVVFVDTDDDHKQKRRHFNKKSQVGRHHKEDTHHIRHALRSVVE